MLDSDRTESHIEPRKPDAWEVHRTYVGYDVALIEGTNINVLNNLQGLKGTP